MERIVAGENLAFGTAAILARAGAIDSVEGTILLRRGENPKDVLREVHEACLRGNASVVRADDVGPHTACLEHAQRGRRHALRQVSPFGDKADLNHGLPFRMRRRSV